MKKNLTPVLQPVLRVLLAFAIVGAVFISISCNKVKTEDRRIQWYEWDGNEQEVTLQNNQLELRFFPKTTGFALTDKTTGTVWHSTPEDAGSDPIADGLTKQILQSQFTLVYSDDAGVGVTLPNSRYSIEKGMFEYAVVDGGLEVSYTVGNVARVFYIPKAIREARFVDFLEKMEKSDRDKVEGSYRLYDINRLRANDNKDALLASYPDLEDEKVYVLRDTTQDFMKAQIDDLLASVGYTIEDYEEDAVRYNASAEPERPVFNVTIRYELDGNALVVSVPFDKLAFRPSFPITQLSLLPYFGAGGVQDEGYLLVPDGSGALINFNNGKQGQLAYNNYVYGWDAGMFREAIIHDNKGPFPAFGVQKNGAALLCVIEEGASYASVRADVSGRSSSYNNVYGQYAVIHGASLDISAKSDKAVYMYQTQLPAGERIVQRYILCAEDSYAGMAKEFRKRLLAKEKGLNNEIDGGAPVAVEIIGAVNKTQHRVGVPFDLPLKLTSYEEAEGMVEDFAAFGWKNVNVKMIGWFNGSVEHSVPSNVRLISELGGKNTFIRLVSTARDFGFKLYAESDFLHMYDNSPFDTFSLYTDAARYVTRKRIESYPYSFVWFGERKNWGKINYMATPLYMKELIQNFREKTGKLGVTNIAFRTIGAKLGGDYYEKRFVSREASMNMQKETLAELKGKGRGVLVNTGFLYTAPYADFITDVPLVDQAFGITDVSVPFYQIVLHGLVPFAGRAINLAEDYRLNLLKSIEGGAGLYFSFMTEDSAILQETKFRQFYANEYGKWVGDANAIYQRFARDFDGLFNQKIDNHEILAPNITLTVYENGTKVLVNASKTSCNYEGKNIASYDYAVIKQEE
ncbi:MAG: DUF5696 domain-containing protein [Treponema sp.]|jgi:hypothetical protein|nr:DUF5696 domain-containing protein [Treponema sp.]